MWGLGGTCAASRCAVAHAPPKSKMASQSAESPGTPSPPPAPASLEIGPQIQTQIQIQIPKSRPPALSRPSPLPAQRPDPCSPRADGGRVGFCAVGDEARCRRTRAPAPPPPYISGQWVRVWEPMPPLPLPPKVAGGGGGGTTPLHPPPRAKGAIVGNNETCTSPRVLDPPPPHGPAQAQALGGGVALGRESPPPPPVSSSDRPALAPHVVLPLCPPPPPREVLERPYPRRRREGVPPPPPRMLPPPRTLPPPRPKGPSWETTRFTKGEVLSELLGPRPPPAKGPASTFASLTFTRSAPPPAPRRHRSGAMGQGLRPGTAGRPSHRGPTLRSLVVRGAPTGTMPSGRAPGRPDRHIYGAFRAPPPPPPQRPPPPPQRPAPPPPPPGPKGNNETYKRGSLVGAFSAHALLGPRPPPPSHTPSPLSQSHAVKRPLSPGCSVAQAVPDCAEPWLGLRVGGPWTPSAGPLVATGAGQCHGGQGGWQGSG